MEREIETESELNAVGLCNTTHLGLIKNPVSVLPGCGLGPWALRAS